MENVKTVKMLKVKTWLRPSKMAHSNTPPHVYVTMWKNINREPRRGNSDFAMTIWRFSISNCMHDVFAIDCSNAEFWASCVCVQEKERVTVESAVLIAACVRERERLAACLQTHHHCVCHATQFPSGAWTDAKTKDIINCLYFHFESWSLRLWKGALHFWCGLWCSANHNALC